MDEIHRVEQTGRSRHKKARSLAFLARLATAGALMNIFSSWNTLGGVEKSTSIALLLPVVLTPRRAMRAEGHGKPRLGRDQAVKCGSMFLMLASILIGQ